ncbi:MAG: pilin [Patescibacteria group bacterium]
MKKYLIIFVFLGILLASAVGAQSEKTASDANTNTNCGPGSLTLCNPLGATVDSPQVLIGRVINSILGVVGSLALLMFVYGGLTWMLSSGNQEKVKKGKDIIIWSAIGLAVIFMAYAATSLLINTLQKG